jgi:outer membrane receptor protein involved in Fe transport
MVVTADRVPQTAATVASKVTVLDRATIDISPSLAVDDFLRQVPGFQLFRRSSSLVANPTTQGVSLRGLGASGASRTLVLLDGVPLNDPFGGWVPWSRVPLDALERVEIVNGPGAAAWGNYAMGGVINLITQPASAAPTARLTGEGGNRGTARGSGWLAGRQGPLGLSLHGEWLGFEGFPVVRDDQRGTIDVDAGSRHGVVDGRLEWAPAPGIDAHLHTNLFLEDRDNGTPLTGNSTRAADVDVGARMASADGSEWTLLGFTKLTSYDSQFSAQATDRSRERPASDQFSVPAVAIGGALQWTRSFEGALRLSAGLDGSWIEGTNHEDGRFMDRRFTQRTTEGADALLGGGWMQASGMPLPTLRVTAGLRIDGWRSFDGVSRVYALSGGRTLEEETLPASDAVVAQPSLALRWTVVEGTVLRAGAARGFRAPTINELVRGFRVRNDITAPNPSLRPETLYGGEIGAEQRWGPLDASVTAYWDVVQDPIANVTVGSGPGDVGPCGFVPAGGICRQRRNLGALRARGVQADVSVRVASDWRFSAGGVWQDSQIVSAPQQPVLAGRRVPQVPELAGSIAIAWEPASGPRAGLQMRYVGQQFEDDLNTLSLGGFAIVDLFLGWRVGERWEVFFRLENAFDRVYPVGRTADGLETIGTPLLAHGGVTVTF